MAAPPTPDDIWLHFIQAGYYDAAPGPACLYCNPNPVRTEEGDMEDRRTSSAPPGPNTGSPNTGRKKKEKTGKECKRSYCIPCQEGGLCASEFHLEGRPHSGHLGLQIFRTSYENSVRQEDIIPLLDTTIVMGICSNSHTVHSMSTRKVSTAVTNVMHCQGCGQRVATAKGVTRKGNAIDARVCSIQCLLVYRARRGHVNYRRAHRRKQGEPTQSPLN